MLKNAKGERIRNEDNLNKMTGTFFNNFYTSVDFRNFQPILSQSPSSVDAIMNKKLIEPVTMEEITTATHQLGATKAPRPNGLNGLFFQHHWQEIN